MSRLLTSVSRLARRHEHHLLRWLAGLRILVHHHRGATAWAGVAAMRLRRCVLWVRVAWRWRVHLHLRCIGGHTLRHTHIRTVRRLLHHHRGSHLRVYKLRTVTTLVMSHMGRLRTPIKLRHWLSKRKLCWGSHRRGVSHVALLHARGGEDLR